MPIDRKRFTVAFLVANVVLIGVLSGLAAAGVGVAVPITGASGFTVAFDELEGDGFEQYSTMESHDGCASYPVSETRIDNGTIEGLHLFKDLEMPVTNETVRVSIESDSMEFQGLSQRFTHLEGNITFEGTQVVEYDDDRDTMRISARNITIQNGTIQTENQYITHLSLDELSVDVVTNPDETGGETPAIDCQSTNGTASPGSPLNGTVREDPIPNDTDTDSPGNTDRTSATNDTESRQSVIDPR